MSLNTGAEPASAGIGCVKSERLPLIRYLWATVTDATHKGFLRERPHDINFWSVLPRPEDSLEPLGFRPDRTLGLLRLYWWAYDSLSDWFVDLSRLFAGVGEWLGITVSESRRNRPEQYRQRPLFLFASSQVSLAGTGWLPLPSHEPSGVGTQRAYLATNAAPALVSLWFVRLWVRHAPSFGSDAWYHEAERATAAPRTRAGQPPLSARS
jgi:hypothetical protein